MKFTEGKIVLDKELNNLDLFAVDFIKLLEKHTRYVLVSGYVSILFGRSRISEDIDVLIPRLTFEQFLSLHTDLSRKEFECINVDDTHELYALLTSKHSIRYARKGKIIPNMEVKFIDTPAQRIPFENRIEVVLKNTSLFICPLESQIMYKELVLKSPKDLEDALHLREVFKGHLDKEKIAFYKSLLQNHG